VEYVRNKANNIEMQNKNIHFASKQLDDLTLGLQQAKNLYCLDIEPLYHTLVAATVQRVHLDPR
jgi:hypothetical protein